MPDALLTLPDAAAQLAISRRTLEREIASGRIATVRVRGAVRVAQSDIDAYIVRLRRYQEQPDPCQSANVATFGTSVSRSRGQRIERTTGRGATRADALALEAQIRRDHVDGRVGRAPKRTIDQAVARWLTGEGRPAQKPRQSRRQSRRH